MFVLESKSDPTSETKYSDSIHVDKPFEKESKMVENTVTEEKVTVEEEEEEEKAEVNQVTDEKKDDLASRRAARLERRREKAGATSDDKASETTEESEDGTSSSRGSLAAKRAERRARRENKPAVAEDKANAENKVEEVQSLINERRAAHRNVANAGDDIPKRADEEVKEDKEDTAAVRRQERRERAARRRNSKEALAKQESTLEEDHLSQARKSSSEETSKYTGIVKARFEEKGKDEQKNITSTQERRSKDSEEQLIDQRCKDENYENEVQVWSLSLKHYVFRGRNATFFKLKHKESTYGSCNLNNAQLLCIFLSKILTT